MGPSCSYWLETNAASLHRTVSFIGNLSVTANVICYPLVCAHLWCVCVFIYSMLGLLSVLLSIAMYRNQRPKTAMWDVWKKTIRLFPMIDHLILKVTTSSLKRVVVGFFKQFGMISQITFCI